MVEFWVYVCIFVKMEYVCKELIGEYKAVVQKTKAEKVYWRERCSWYIRIDEFVLFLCWYRKTGGISYQRCKRFIFVVISDTIPADYIISGDKDLLVLGKHNETRILDYNSFLSLL